MSFKTNKGTSRSRDPLKVRRLPSFRNLDTQYRKIARSAVSLLGPITKTSPSVSGAVSYPALRFVLFFMYVIYNCHFKSVRYFRKDQNPQPKQFNHLRD
jgi:hypothetical protein